MHLCLRGLNLPGQRPVDHWNRESPCSRQKSRSTFNISIYKQRPAGKMESRVDKNNSLSASVSENLEKTSLVASDKADRGLPVGRSEGGAWVGKQAHEQI